MALSVVEDERVMDKVGRSIVVLSMLASISELEGQ